jgi:SAM-dependent methyltransferase
MATDEKEERRFVRDLIRPTFSFGLPAYLLDLGFRFLEWNAAFQEIFAGPLNLTPGQHVQQFVSWFENGPASIDRALRVFAVGHAPIVDTEPLVLQTAEYGKIEFQKFATQILDVNGRPAAWLVTFNISSAERAPELYDAMARAIEAESLWSSYSGIFEGLQQKSKSFAELVDRVVAALGSPRKVLCQGSSTGYDISRLLHTNPKADLVICETCFTMKEKISRQHGSLRLIPLAPGEFGTLHDAAFDAVYTFDGMNRFRQPARSLKEIARVLSPGGVFSGLIYRPDLEASRFVMNASGMKRKSDMEALENFRQIMDRLKILLPAHSLSQWKEFFHQARLEITSWDDNVLDGQACWIVARKSG